MTIFIAQIETESLLTVKSSINKQKESKWTGKWVTK
jgi:hypothetical protein